MLHLGSMCPQLREHKRPISNLLNFGRIASHPKVRYQAAASISALQAPISEWIGAECPVDYLNVWFPAHWAPLVFQANEDYRAKNPMWFDAPAQATETIKLVRERAEALQSRELHFQAGKMDPEGDIPTLIGRLKVDWIDFPAEDAWLDKIDRMSHGWPKKHHGRQVSRG